MKYDRIMVRFGELSTKGKNKRDFILKLASNLKHALKEFKNLKYEVQMDHIYIILNDENSDDVLERIADVSGISSYSLVVKCDVDIDKIIDTSYNLVLQENGKTFKVKARRADKTFPYISDDVNRLVATKILKDSEYKVDVHNPDVLVSIDIRKTACYIYTKKIAGAGGYPLGVGGKAMMMMSGGIDSPVAAYLLMKRGVSLEFIHFAAPPYTSEAVIDKLRDLAKKLNRYQEKILIHIVPFTKLQVAIYEHADESYAITIMRRMMYRLAERLAKKRSCYAIANGESVGQVASQTLASMFVINEVTSYPIIRPVCVMDKVEIIKIARKIDTYDISIRPYEDCCTIFEPKNPKTAPKLDISKEIESSFDFESLIKECLDNIETITIDSTSVEQKYL